MDDNSYSPPTSAPPAPQSVTVYNPIHRSPNFASDQVNGFSQQQQDVNLMTHPSLHSRNSSEPPVAHPNQRISTSSQQSSLSAPPDFQHYSTPPGTKPPAIPEFPSAYGVPDENESVYRPRDKKVVTLASTVSGSFKIILY